MIFLNPISMVTHHQNIYVQAPGVGRCLSAFPEGLTRTDSSDHRISRPHPRDGLDVTVGWGGNLEQLGSSQHWSLSFGTQSHLGLGSESRDPKANMNEARRPGLALCFPCVKPASLGFLYPNIVSVVGCDRPVPTAERSRVLLIGIAVAQTGSGTVYSCQ